MGDAALNTGTRTEVKPGIVYRNIYEWRRLLFRPFDISLQLLLDLHLALEGFGIRDVLGVTHFVIYIGSLAVQLSNVLDQWSERCRYIHLGQCSRVYVLLVVVLSLFSWRRWFHRWSATKELISKYYVNHFLHSLNLIIAIIIFNRFWCWCCYYYAIVMAIKYISENQEKG